MFRIASAAILAVSASAECWRVYGQDLSEGKSKLPQVGKDYKSQCQMLTNMPCVHGVDKVMKDPEVKRHGAIWFKPQAYPEAYRKAYMHNENQVIPHLEWAAFSETYPHATVEEWTAGVCIEHDFVTKRPNGVERPYWKTRHIAEYKFIQSGKDRHILNQFWIDNGMLIEDMSKLVMDGEQPPKEVEDVNPFAVDIIEEGTGESVGKGSIVMMHYTGKLVSDGTVFDSSHSRDTPFKFKQGMGAVIKCWDEAVLDKGFKKGTIATITCPSRMAYGQGGTKNIPANADVTFDLELLDFIL